MVEKYGGIWLADGEKSLEVVHERYDSERDIVQAIYRRATDGFYTVAVYEKSNEPQWRLPVWVNVEHGSIFDHVELAEAHLMSILVSREK
jgi:hypothetical protein